MHGVNLHAIEPGFLCHFGSLDHISYLRLNLFCRQHAGNLGRIRISRNWGWRLARPHAPMPESNLHEGLRPVIVNAFHQPACALPPFARSVRRRNNAVNQIRLIGLHIHNDASQHDQPKSSPSPLQIILDSVIPIFAAGTAHISGTHGCHRKAIL